MSRIPACRQAGRPLRIFWDEMRTPGLGAPEIVKVSSSAFFKKAV